MGRGGSKKCKPIPAPPLDAGLKSHPIPAPSPLRGGENPHGAKRGGAGQAGRGKIAIPNLIDHFKNIIKSALKKLFSLYFCFKNNGSLALPLKRKRKKETGNLYSSIRTTKKIKS